MSFSCKSSNNSPSLRFFSAFREDIFSSTHSSTVNLCFFAYSSISKRWCSRVCLLELIYSCYDETIGRRKEINNVTHYCSQEQLPKTGKQACIDAKKTVINRLRGDLNDTNKTLKETRLETPKLLQNKNKKCTKSGLELYGTEGCANAKNSLEKNYQRIEELKSKIKTYQSDIGKYKRFGVDGSHIVDTNILNLRSCASTNCSIVAKLSLGEGVWLQETNGEWSKIRSEKGNGFVANKFLMVNEDKKSHNPNKKSDDNLCGIGVFCLGFADLKHLQIE